MIVLITSFKFLLLLILIVFPLFNVIWLNKLKLKKSFTLYLILGLVVTLFLTFLIAWWSYFSNEILLSYYGYDFEAMNDIDRYKNVAIEDFKNVESLRRSIMGIGWPLKAIMFYTIYCPYFLVLYMISYIYKRNKSIK